MQLTMHYPNVLEYHGDFDKPLPTEEIDEMIKYNINDVDSTSQLLNSLKKDIDLREWIEEEYGIIESMFKEMSENPKFDETVTGIQKTGQTVNGYACKWIKTDYMVDGTKKSMIQCAAASKDNTYSVCVLFNVSGEEAVERMDDVFSDILYGIDFDD